MTIAVIVTIFVSLTLVGHGPAAQRAGRTRPRTTGAASSRSRSSCATRTPRPPTASTVRSPTRRRPQIQKVLDDQQRGRVATAWRPSRRPTTSGRRAYVSDNDTERRVYQSIKPSDMQESYWVQLKDPEKFQGIKSAVQGLPGRQHASATCAQVLKPIYFWMNVMQVGRDLGRGVPGGRGGPAGRQHDPARGVRATPGDRHHAAGRRLQPLHPAAVPDGVAGRRPDRGRPGRGGDHAASCGW